MGPFIVLPRNRRQPRPSMQIRKLFILAPAIPLNIQARLKFNPSRCENFGSLGSGDTTGLKPDKSGRNSRNHSAKSSRRQHAPHHIRLRQPRRKKILARRFILYRRIAILQ